MPRIIVAIFKASACIGLGAAMASPGDVAFAVGSSPFDGNWTVGIYCTVAPDGAKAYRWELTAAVQGGALSGQYGDVGAINSGTLTGKIKPSGDAVLRMKGRTGDAGYTIGKVNPGSPYQYTANVHFDGAHASGKRNEGRECTLDFSKL
jgi:hypothetical protein